MTRWIIVCTIVLAVPTGVALSSVRDTGKNTQHARALAAKQYWVTEFRQRWKVERRTAHKQANVIRKLRSKASVTKVRVRNLQSAMRSSPYGTHYLETGMLCIHGHEGSWDSNTGNGYYGGMQMDTSFQKTYGREFYDAFGTANNWPVSVQIAVAIKAYLSGRGYGPWPNTRRMCGI